MDIRGKSKDGTKSSCAVVQQDYVLSESGFLFRNGDKYEGGYLALRSPLLLVREGYGTYWTNDNFEFKGLWRNDALEKAEDIVFPDKSRFTGTLENMALEGFGVYKFKENIQIQGDFVNNQFIGNLELRDPLGHCWKALNAYTENEVFFYPFQPFWQSVLDCNKVVLISGEGEE